MCAGTAPAAQPVLCAPTAILLLLPMDVNLLGIALSLASFLAGLLGGAMGTTPVLAPGKSHRSMVVLACAKMK